MNRHDLFKNYLEVLKMKEQRHLKSQTGSLSFVNSLKGEHLAIFHKGESIHPLKPKP